MQKKNILRIAALLLMLPVLLCLCGFLPPQYHKSYPAALQDKIRLLEAPAEKPRILIIGGSAAAFGVDSGQLAAAFPEYETVHFGLYAGFGLPMMLELAKDALRPGDLVLVMPEQQRQSLSDYFNAEAVWQAADGDYSWLLRLEPRHWPALIAAYPAFVLAKLRYVLTGTMPEPDEIYRRDSFDDSGNMRNAAVSANTMPGGWDQAMPIELNQNGLPDSEWLNLMEEFVRLAADRQASVWYAFCPMNEKALTEASDVDAYYDALWEQLPCDILGDPRDSVMNAGWFYDTNFHLNASGRTVFTDRLIRALKAELGISTPTVTDLPQMPAFAELTAENGDNRDQEYFLWTERDGQAVVTGISETGRQCSELTVPTAVNGCPVTALADGLFTDCQLLKTVRMQWTSPNSCKPSQGLMNGAPENMRLIVPAGCADQFKLNYFWSVYADRITEER